MIQYLYAGGGIIALAFIGAVAWFAYRNGKNAGVLSVGNAAKSDADTSTKKAEAMAQAQADKPQTEDDIISRLDTGNA